MLGKVMGACLQVLFVVLMMWEGPLWAGQSPSKSEYLFATSRSMAEKPAPKSAPRTAVNEAQPLLTTRRAAEGRQRYTALFIDDYHLSIPELPLTREAVGQYLAKALHSRYHIGVFTASGEISTEFTNDPHVISAAVHKLRAQTRFLRGGYCPDITPYHAQRILESEPEAIGLGVALTFLCRCRCPSSIDTALSTAMLISIHSDIATGNTLKALEHAVGRMEGLPRRRTVTIISDGFLRGTHGEDVEALENRAKRQGISISALNPRQTCQVISTTNVGPSLSPQDAATAEKIARRSCAADAEVLRELVTRTGGVFIEKPAGFELP